MMAPSPARFAYVGTYTTAARNARGTGLHVYQVDPTTGDLSPVQHVGDLVNPSFLVTSHDRRHLYAVHGDEEYATAFALDPATGMARRLNSAATGGRNGVRQDIDPTGRFMIVANYGAGTVAVMAINADGSLSPQHQLVELTGELGPYRHEQSASHPHDIRFDPTGRFVFIPDKGLDSTFVFRFDPASGRLSPTDQAFAKSRSGAAPRHIGFHPTLPVAWVLNELDNTVVTYALDRETGAMTPQQCLPTLPETFTGDSTTAEIAVSPDGRFVYCSNRGHASIAIFNADPTTGRLTAIGWESTRGEWPRFITLDPTGRFMYAANEHGDSIVIFRVDTATGMPVPTSRTIAVASPATIAFA